MTKEIANKLAVEFKKNLKSILEERKSTTNSKRLSVDAGLGETAVRDILKDRSASPKLDTVQKLAKALNLPLYRLIPSMIDQSYEELEVLREENRLLKEAHSSSFQSIDDLRKAAKERSKKKP